MRLAAVLLKNGASAALPARIEAASNRPPAVYLPRPMAADIRIPPLLAPFLSDSPCATALHVNVLKRKDSRSSSSGVFSAMGAMVMSSAAINAAPRRPLSGGRPAHVDFSVSRMEHVWLSRVAPLVDGGLLGGEEGSQLAELIRITGGGDPGGRVGGEADLADAVDARALVPLMFGQVGSLPSSVVDPDPYVFGLPGSGSVSQRYGSGSVSFYHQAKIVRKP